MAKATIPTPVDTTEGSAAYALAIAHQPDLQARLPADTLTDLAADLTLLGAPPPEASTPASSAPATTTPAAPTATPDIPIASTSLADATATAVALITGIHAAIRGAKAPTAVRKAYGVSSRTTTSPKAVVLDGQKIVTQAQADPSQALALGILPEDTAALVQALATLTAAETAAKGTKAMGITGKARRAAEVRMNEAVARIAGAGVLAFATRPALRALFEALLPTKKKS